MVLATSIRPGNDVEAFAEQRRRMVERQLRRRGIHSPEVLDAMLAIPRHEFVPPTCRKQAYDDKALSVADGQSLSQPLMVALMTEALTLSGAERVLEIGTGTGYQTAVLSRLAAEVYSIEYRDELAAAARERLARLGCRNVHLRQGDGGSGWPEAAPFDAILVAAAAPAPPLPLARQLAPGGRMVIPVGSRVRQKLVLIRKLDARIERRELCPCAFVPLLGIHGWGRPLDG
jgi:protein-L-isoaspartate(D-aspartate) O-methyltransferase